MTGTTEKKKEGVVVNIRSWQDLVRQFLPAEKLEAFKEELTAQTEVDLPKEAAKKEGVETLRN